MVLVWFGPGNVLGVELFGQKGLEEESKFAGTGGFMQGEVTPAEEPDMGL